MQNSEATCCCTWQLVCLELAATPPPPPLIVLTCWQGMAAGGGPDGPLPDLHRYVVARPIYNEPTFQEENERRLVLSKTLRERVHKACRSASGHIRWGDGGEEAGIQPGLQVSWVLLHGRGQRVAGQGTVYVLFHPCLISHFVFGQLFKTEGCADNQDLLSHSGMAA